jgi:ElaB/YqjD/DUF883 family membrane-anchored ribosome-binding protein
MEQQKDTSFNTETNKPSPGKLGDRNAEFYDQTKKTISDTYNKTTEALNKGSDQAVAYGRQNPGTAVLIALGSGLVVGLLLASRSRGRQNFYSSYAEPVVNTLSDIVSDFLRRR